MLYLLNWKIIKVYILYLINYKIIMAISFILKEIKIKL